MGDIIAGIVALSGLIAFILVAADSYDPPPLSRWSPEDWWTDA
jgi:hypothetical protein